MRKKFATVDNSGWGGGATNRLADRSRSFTFISSQSTMTETGESHAAAAVAADATAAVCDACGLPPEPSKKLVRCGRCKSAWYHNAECQRMAYPAHKKRCRQATATPAATTSTSSTAVATAAVTTAAASNSTAIHVDMFTVARRPNRGRCMIANRNLRKGTRILSGNDSSFQPMVAPVLMLSAQSIRCAYCFARLSQNDSDPSASCLVLDGPPPQMRPLCHYFCSNRCMNRCKDHAQEEEMAAFQCVHRQSQQQEGRASKGATIRPTALLLFRLICYMIETANHHDCITDLESHIDALDDSRGDDRDEMNFIRTTAAVAKGLFMCSRWSGAVQNTGIVSHILDDDYLQSAVSKIATNAFTICDGEGSSLGFGLYPAAAVINHSCEPNLVQTFQYGGSDGQPPTLLLTTCRSIVDRDELCIAYTDITAPAQRRRETLLKGYKFTCRCSRCESAVDGDGDEGITVEAQKRLDDGAYSIVERAMVSSSAANGNNFSSGASTGSPQSSCPTLNELQESYRSIKECCAKNSYYFQEAGEALVRSLLDRVGEAESEAQQRELCFQALSVLEELEKNSDEQQCAVLCPLPSLIRRYKIAKLQLFLVHDPRPSLMMLQDVHSELLVYFPRDHELIRDLESTMRGGMSG